MTLGLPVLTFIGPDTSGFGYTATDDDGHRYSGETLTDAIKAYGRAVKALVDAEATGLTLAELREMRAETEDERD